MLPIDADSHFIEPFDLFLRWIDPPFVTALSGWRKIPRLASPGSSSIRDRFV
jgi:hypothetical protein